MTTRRRRRELADEVEAHIAERAEELMESGVSETAARQQARREFGNPTLISEAGGEIWGWTWLERLIKDFRYAARALRASPLFTFTAVLSLALGIGANTAIFTLLYATLWKPLPVPAQNRIFQVRCYAADGPWTGEGSYSYVLFQELAGTARGTGEVFAKSSFGVKKFSAQGVSSERVSGESVSANFFSALGIEAQLGRFFEPADDSVLGGNHVAVLSHTFWTHRFQSNPGILGQTIFYDEAPYTVVGVAPAGFSGIDAEAAIDVWVPVTSTVAKEWLTDPNVNWLKLAVRLRPGVPPAQAQAMFEKAYRVHVADKLAPDAGPRWKSMLDARHITLRPAAGGMATTGHKYEKPLQLIMVLVALVLLITCGNVANLMLARNASRQHEITIRRALGAGSARIVSQLFCESLLLAALSGAGGLALAVWGARALLTFLPQPEVPLAFDLHPGLAVLGFTAAAGMATALLFGLLPAWRAGRASTDLSLRTAQRATRTSVTGRLLVSGQLALSLVLLIGAGLFVATLRNLKNADLGFRAERVVTVDLSFPKGTPEEQIARTQEQLKQRLESHPGIVVASFAWPSIYSRGGWDTNVEVDGRPAAPNEDNSTGMIAAGPGMFEALGMRLVAGRYLNAQDQRDQPPVAVVNETFARHYFGAQSPLGRRIQLARPKLKREIVGVVGDARHFGVRDNVWRMVYLASPKAADGSLYVRMDREGRLPGGVLRVDLAAIDKAAQIQAVQPMETAVNDMISAERLTATLSTLFGALAMVLAAVGLYGVVAYSVSRRTNEFGIRMALGAQRGDVQRLVLRQTIVMVMAGVAIGLAAAAVLARILAAAMAGMLYGIRADNAAVFAGATLLLAAIALLAAVLPARRASRIDPIVALRYD